MVFTIAWGWMMYSFGDFGFTETSKFLMIDAIATFAWATANRLPGQILGPVPNGRYTQRSMNDLTPPCSGPNRSGSNLFGVGKYSSSMKKEMIGISTMEFLSKKSFLSFGRSTSTGSLHNLLKCVAGLCSRSDSVWLNWNFGSLKSKIQSKSSCYHAKLDPSTVSCWWYRRWNVLRPELLLWFHREVFPDSLCWRRAHKVPQQYQSWMCRNRLKRKLKFTESLCRQ